MVKTKEKSDYMKEKNTTIALSMKVKEGLQEYGMKGESYSEILARLLKSANERMLSDVLMDQTNCVSIEDAIKEAQKKWPK